MHPPGGDDLAAVLAGMTSDEGDAGPPVTHGGWIAPASAYLDGPKLLRWRWDEEQPSEWTDVVAASERRREDSDTGAWRTPTGVEWLLTGGQSAEDLVVSTTGLLRDLMAMSRPPLTASAICGFVTTWGVPELCAHGLPFAHLGPVRVSAVNRAAEVCPRYADDKGEAVRVDDLLAWSRRAGAVWRAGASIRLGRRPSAGDMALAAGARAWPSLGDAAADLQRTIEAMVVAESVDDLLGLAGVRPSVRWLHQPSGYRVDVRPWGPLGAAALQLALALARADGFAMCDGCGKTYVPRRKPAVGKRHFCPTCRGDGVPVRLAQRDQLARRRQAQGQCPQDSAAEHGEPDPTKGETS